MKIFFNCSVDKQTLSGRMRKLKKINVVFVACVVCVLYTKSNLYFGFSEEPISEESKSETSCGSPVKNIDIKSENQIWQTLQLRDESYKILNAYYDDRIGKRLVRFTVLGKEMKEHEDPMYCQFWKENTPDEMPTVVQVIGKSRMWGRSKFAACVRSDNDKCYDETGLIDEDR